MQQSIFTKRLARWAAAAGLAALSAATPALAESPAKQLFGAESRPSAAPPESYGFYAKGCMSGGVAMPKDGPTWQVMKLERNRAWGQPQMIAFLKKLSQDAARTAGWRGLLLGDIAQPRGGPMVNGHASHQIGLDADIYLTEMPNRRLSDNERNTMDLPSLIDPRTKHLDERRWRPEIAKLIKTAAEEPEVQRIFVHPGIKEKLCKVAGRDRDWLNKVRPMYGHDYHFHVRLFCPPGDANCKPQESTGTGDGCDKLDWWFNVALQPPKPSAKPYKAPPPIMMRDLPTACAAVLKQPDATGFAAAGPAAAPAAPAAAYASPTPVTTPAPSSDGLPMPRFRPGS